MERECVLEDLREVFEDVFDDEVDVQESLTADQVEDWDSLSHIRLVSSVEEHFQVRFSAAEVSQLKCVGDLVSLIVWKRV